MVNQKKYALELLTDIQAYRRLIGRLMYLTNTRPDITFSVQQLSQFLDKPTIAHYNATIRILRYIKGVPSLGLFFSSTTSVHLKAFCDGDWGTCSEIQWLTYLLQNFKVPYTVTMTQ